ncbi:glycosyltransferase family 2 protein [uncultured Pseudokineococcus sp.]|uniref:glycosyltransferase family 2 protein n=1 Tax=uncultured Pseudokineococcus sp. TaxID=1642928 RepID=UPI00260BA1D9|nr:glycosyltransferase [uncultured Pseudokineococcus sp.]
MSAPPDPSATPSVSVVIPTLNGGATLGTQLEALARQRTQRVFEVLVADNGSSDNTQEVVSAYAERRPRLKLVDASERIGSNVARNAGCRVARGAAILLCDSDDEVDEDWVEQMARGLESAEGVGGRLDLLRLNPRYAAVNAGEPPIQGMTEPLGFLSRPIGANAGFSRAVWEQLGGFDESYARGGVETEFFWRLQLAGYRLVEVPEAVVHYRLRSTFRKSVKQMYIWGRQHVKLYRDFRGQGVEYRPIDSVKAWLALVPLAGKVVRYRTHKTQLGQQLAYRVGRCVGTWRYRTFFV